MDIHAGDIGDAVFFVAGCPDIDEPCATAVFKDIHPAGTLGF